MKKLYILFIFILAVHEQAFAYLNDVVSIQETTKDKSPAAASLMQAAADNFKKALLKDFPCLKVSTKDEIKKALDKLREKELIGPRGRQWIDNAREDNKKNPLDQTYSADEESVFRDSIQKEVDELGKSRDAKYVILLTATADPLVNLRVSAINISWTKKSGLFYQENRMYPSTEAASADIKRITDELVKAFVENASRDKWNNEVCPFKGKVDVKVTTRRNQKKEETFFDYCNGQDHQGRKLESFFGEMNQSWKLERYGNPDTKGSMEYSLLEKTVREEVTGCHECASGRRGPWSFSDETETTGSANGLDSSTFSKGLSDNKDATVKLHFSTDGTYKVSIKAVSNEGTKHITKTTVATGTCDNLNKKPKPEKQPVTIPLERQFGPYNGTVRDKRLKEKQVLELKDDHTEEVTEYAIEFDLERPEAK